MFIAILATILPMFEKVSQQRIKSVEGFIWSRYIMSILKGCLMMTVFVVNKGPNDFFIGWSFFFTILLGFIYLYINPYQDPEKTHKIKPRLDEDKNEKLIRDYLIRAEHDIYSRYMETGFKMVSCLSVMFFLVMVTVSIYSPQIPIGVMGMYVKG